MIDLINRRFVAYYFNRSGNGLGGNAAASRFTSGKTKNPYAYLAAFTPDRTLALYMAVANFGAIAAKLTELGHPRDLPLAVVENGTTASQRVIVSTLAELPSLAAEHEVRSPALLLVGKTVRYAERYGWFNPELVALAAQNGLADVI